MTGFSGFPARMQFTAVPNIVFSAVMPQIADIVELKVLFHILALTYPKKSTFRAVGLNELLSDPAVANDLKLPPGGLLEALRKALADLEGKNIILRVGSNPPGQPDEYYCLNSEANQSAIARIRKGEQSPPPLRSPKMVPVSAGQTADIFSLYEENIGLLTPIIADELKEAEKHYPETWIQDAIKEAVTLNRRNWRYIARILERWLTEGKDVGTHRGNLKASTDPDKYIRGKYGHMVQR